MEKEKLSEIGKKVTWLELFDVAMRVIRKTFVYKGRASKTELKKWVVFCILTSNCYFLFFCYIPVKILDSEFITSKVGHEFVLMISKILDVLYYTLLLFILLPTISVVIRRLHDTNRSDRWIGCILIPIYFAFFLLLDVFLGKIVPEIFSIGIFGFLGLLCFDVVIPDVFLFPIFTLFLILIVMSCLGFVFVGKWCMEEGTHGPNKYGEEPQV